MAPWHCWGGRNTTVINNNFFGGGFRGSHCHGGGFRGWSMPMFNFGGSGCGCHNGAFNWNMGFNNGFWAGMNMNNMAMFNMYNNSTYMGGGFLGGLFGGGGRTVRSSEDADDTRTHKNDKAEKNKMNKAQKDLDKLLKEKGIDSKDCTVLISDDGKIMYSYNDKLYGSLEDLKAAMNGDKTDNTDKKDNTGKTENSQKTDAAKTDDTKKPDGAKKTEEVTVGEIPDSEITDIKEEPQTEIKTLDEALKHSGVEGLTPEQTEYVKKHITQVSVGDNGELLYDITAVAHDTDSVAKITSRFYTKDEKPDLQVGTAKFNTWPSETNTITEPHSGNKIVAKGVSAHGIAALAEDAKANITSTGEITKTNKRMTEMKADFQNGKQKLSWAYINQNKMFTKAEYDKIISEKYTKPSS